MHKSLLFGTGGLLLLGGMVGLVLAAAQLVLEEVPGPPDQRQHQVLGAREGRVPTSYADPSPLPSLPTRMVIERIGVDAPLSVKGRDAAGAMELPKGPEDVAWYDFTARPGAPGNAVFSGHVDYRDYGPAVFARLDDLRSGDIIEVLAADGAVYRYAVAASAQYLVGAAPVQDIVGPAAREVITLITCSGSFDPASRSYSHRLVVRGERV